MKKNNRIVKNIVIGGLSVAIVLSACTDLKTNEIDSEVINTTSGTFSGNPTELLASAYDDLGAFTDQANLYALQEQPTDEMIPPTRGVDWGDNGVWRTLHQHTWDATHQQVLDTWNQMNQRAYKCNQILASSPSPAQTAEAKFLRAFFMYQVMDLYGQVPFRDVNEGVNVAPKVMTRSEAFDFIEKDLQDAVAGLTKIGPQAVQNKASKAAANFLLAKLYLNKAVYKQDPKTPQGPYTFNKAHMDKVIGYVDAIKLDGYNFEPEYFNNFSTDASKEIIFTSPSGTPQNRYYMTLHYDQNPSGWNGFATLADFYAKFNDDDSRKAAPSPVGKGKDYHGITRGFLIGQQYKDDETPLVDSRTQKPLAFTKDVPLSGAATDKGIRVIKYHPANKGNYILMRYADAALMKAEAIVRGGAPTLGETAASIVNGLRAVRKTSALPTVDLAAILDERGRELYWEGVRRNDQIRFGTFTGTWSEKTVTETFRVLFPIPQQAVDSNPNLSQNPGY